MDFGQISTRPCENVPVPPDPRCSDPAFAAANPDICPAVTGLIIKPGVVLCCVLGSVQFRAFTVLEGVETDVTGLAAFASSDMNIAVIGVVSGNATATGIQAGEVTISATYNGLTAHTAMTVLAVSGDGCCGNEEVALTVLLDTSLSMSQIFNSSYATKLTYAKAAAAQFISEINATKDLIGLDIFNSDQVTTLAAPTHDKASVGALVPPIAQTQSDTAFFNALQQAINDLNSTSANLKLILLISDGLATAAEPNDPNALLTDFKSQGGVVMCLGVRAAPVGFAALASFATPGFFVNAYDTTAADALSFISGLKGYVCAGNCTPAGDVIVHAGELNYGAFINWDLRDGSVDLQGNGFFDYLPGNGLYVDLISGLAGPLTAQLDLPLAPSPPSTVLASTNGAHGFPIGDSTYYVPHPTPITITGATHSYLNGTFFITSVPNSNQFTFSVHQSGFVEIFDSGSIVGHSTVAPFNGKLSTKNVFGLQTGHQYRLTVTLAGNQLVARAADTVALQLYWLDGQGNPVYLVNQQINISDYKQGFTDYSFAFTSDAPYQVYVAVQQLDVPTISAASGILMSEVKLQDITDLVTLFDDNFDAENPVYVPPRCGRGTTYAFLPDLNAYGYAYGYNCYGVGCLTEPPIGQQPDPFPLADVESGDAPPFTTYSSSQTQCAACGPGFANLVGCTGYGNPPVDCSTVFTAGIVFGYGIFLYTYQLYEAQAAIAYQLTREPSSGTGPPSAWDFQGSNDGSTWITLDSQFGQMFASGQTKVYGISDTTPYLYYRISATDGAPQETLFQIYLQAAKQACATASAESTISQADADAKAAAAALLLAQAKLNCEVVFTSTQSYTATCASGQFGQPVTKIATALSTVSQADADSKALSAAIALAEAAINCNGSNNTQTIQIPDRGSLPGPAPAVPFPSVKFVSGLTGMVTKVTVSIIGLEHDWPSDIVMVLRAPNGTTCAIMAHAGDGGFAIVTPINLVFDDAAGSHLPASGLITAGTWKPTQYPAFADVPLPGPASPYGTTLSVFNGINPNGSWSLWVCDETTPNAGQIVGGFDLTITSA